WVRLGRVDVHDAAPDGERVAVLRRLPGHDVAERGDDRDLRHEAGQVVGPDAGRLVDARGLGLLDLFEGGLGDLLDCCAHGCLLPGGMRKPPGAWLSGGWGWLC